MYEWNVLVSKKKAFGAPEMRIISSGYVKKWRRDRDSNPG